MCMSLRCGHEAQRSLKNNQATTNQKQIFWHCFSNLLFFSYIVLDGAMA